MPNLDPRQMKRIMDSMGIKSSEIEARSVVIHGNGKDIVIDNPHVTKIEAQGNISFQVSGEISESETDSETLEISDDDVRMVMEGAGIDDEAKARAALESSRGDIASAILSLKGQQ